MPQVLLHNLHPTLTLHHHHHHHHHHMGRPITAVHSKSFPFGNPKSTAQVHLRSQPLIGSRRSITCMANPRRVKMVAKQIQRELSDMLLTDKVLQFAVLPEAALGADRYLSSVTTISGVEVSSDLQNTTCKNYVSGEYGVFEPEYVCLRLNQELFTTVPTRMQVVKVYVSVFGDDRGKEVAIAGLKAKAKYVRSKLGKRMKLRLTPEIRFIEDESLERGSRVIAILDRIKAEKEDGKSPHEEQLESSDLPQDDKDWQDDDPDEDIIYVK